MPVQRSPSSCINSKSVLDIFQRHRSQILAAARANENSGSTESYVENKSKALNCV